MDQNTALGSAPSVASISGGAINVSGNILVAEGGNAVLNMSGGAITATNPANGVTFNADSYATAGILNLRGGTLTTGFVTGWGIFNFNGGTLKANQSTATFMQNVTGVYVYGGGATIDDGGNTITIPNSLLAPTGSGVATGGLTVNGTGTSLPRS